MCAIRRYWADRSIHPGTPLLPGRAQLLLWTDSTAAYLEAIRAAGLAGRVAVDTLPRKEKPSAGHLARTEALMAYAVPPGVLPATPETDNFINAGRLGMMKPGAWLLNFGRGHLIRDADPIAAVKAKKIAGAMLDVFRQEPLPADHPFWTTEGIIVLPHISGPHPQRDSIVARLFAENMERFLDGKPLREVVDRDAGY